MLLRVEPTHYHHWVEGQVVLALEPAYHWRTSMAVATTLS